MQGKERISAIVRSHTQSTWGVTFDLVWNTREPDGVVSAIVSPDVARRVTTPVESWWRILDQRRRLAYAVQSVVRNHDGSILAKLRRTPIFALEANRIEKGSPRG